VRVPRVLSNHPCPDSLLATASLRQKGEAGWTQGVHLRSSWMAETTREPHGRPARRPVQAADARCRLCSRCQWLAGPIRRRTVHQRLAENRNCHAKWVGPRVWPEHSRRQRVRPRRRVCWMDSRRTLMLRPTSPRHRPGGKRRRTLDGSSVNNPRATPMRRSPVMLLRSGRGKSSTSSQVGGRILPKTLPAMATGQKHPAGKGVTVRQAIAAASCRARRPEMGRPWPG
jgi:hypothetical protein